MEIRTAINTLLQILVLFEYTAKISNQQKLKAKTGSNISVFSKSDMDISFGWLNNKMRELAIKRQTSSSHLNMTTWALYHNSEFKKLIEQLEKLFSAASAQRTELVTEEAAEVKNAQELQLLEDAAQNVDKLLHAAAKEPALATDT